MTVEDLISLLKTCDQRARVIINDEPICEDDVNLMAGASQNVEAVEIGWCSRDIVSDLTFSLRPIGEYLEPAVRLIGVNTEPTNPEHLITINGLSPMKDAEVSPPLKLPQR